MRELSPHRLVLQQRRGMVLIIVLVVIVLLSLGAYTFSEFMVIEAKATAFQGRALQARAASDSGVEYVSVLLGDRASLPSIGLYHNPSLFQGHLIQNDTAAGGRVRFTVVAPVEGDASATQIRFGLIDESSKLNLNTMAALMESQAANNTTGTASTGGSTGGSSRSGSGSGSPTQSGGTTGGAGSGSGTTSSETEGTLINPLMGLPGMTQEIAEAIFDWIDEDDEARGMGAESAYYQSLAPPYECKNAPLETLDELLLVRGITPELLFGEDANRNGLLDPNENDGAQSAPMDNGDGILDRGWSAYLTVYSRELNLQADRSSKIDVNSNTLSDVYDKLEDEFDEETARFIVAYRLYGPQADPNANNPAAGGTGSTGAPGGGNNNSSTGNSGGNRVTPQQMAQRAGQALAGRSGQVTRGGMDLTNGGAFEIKSLYELVGVQVQATIDTVNTTLESPFPDDPGAMASYIPELMDKISTQGSDQYIEGRININQAHREVLLGLPGMTEDTAFRIVSAQLRGSNGEPLPEADNSRATTLWLYQTGVLDLPTLRKLDPYITGRGDVFRLQVMGHFDGGGPISRVEAVIDATQNPPQPIFFRDLTDLGRGYILPATTGQ